MTDRQWADKRLAAMEKILAKRGLLEIGMMFGRVPLSEFTREQLEIIIMYNGMKTTDQLNKWQEADCTQLE